MARTPLAMHVLRLASRSPSTDGTHGDRDATRAKPHAPPVSAHPAFGPSRATRVARSVRPATASRDATVDMQARIRRGRVLASVRARLQHGRRASPRASRASPRGSFEQTRASAFRSRSGVRLASRLDAKRRDGSEDETSAGPAYSRTRADAPSPRSKRAAGLATLARLAPRGTWRGTSRPERTANGEPRKRNERDDATTRAFAKPTCRAKPFDYASLRLDAAAPPAFSERASRLRAVRVSVPRPTPCGDELWLARRMKEVGDWVPRDRRGSGRARFSLGGVVSRAATRGACSDGFAKKKNDATRRRRANAREPFSSRARFEPCSSVTFTVTPSPFGPSNRHREPGRRRAKGLARGLSNDADDEGFAREPSTRVDDVLAAAAAAWDADDADDDGEQKERASLESLRAARLRR